MLNECYFVGNLTKEVEERKVKSQDGKEYGLAQFTIAVNGKSEKDTSFINCTAWDKKAELALRMLSKGDQVFVKGALHNAMYKNNKNEWVLKSDLLVISFFKIERAEAKKEEPEPPFDFPNGI